MPFCILVSLILVHELGHFLCAIFFKIEVDKIYIYPFGGISKLNISLNENLWKELLVLLMGPIFQMIFSIILTNINYLSSYQELIKIYNCTILSFNLLPIYPLDGGKLLNVILSFNISFKKSLNISLLISYLTIFSLFIFCLYKDIKFNLIIIISFLIYKVFIETKNKEYIFDKFLLDRYLHRYHFKRIKSVNNTDKFMRNKNHIIKIGDKYYTEREILNKKFNR